MLSCNCATAILAHNSLYIEVDIELLDSTLAHLFHTTLLYMHTSLIVD